MRGDGRRLVDGALDKPAIELLDEVLPARLTQHLGEAGAEPKGAARQNPPRVALPAPGGVVLLGAGRAVLSSGPAGDATL